MFYPSRKKAVERMCAPYGAGLVKRVPSLLLSRGKAEFLYSTGALPHPRTLAHSNAVAGLRVDMAVWPRNEQGLHVEFYYGHEEPTSSVLIPDATVVVRKGAKTGLFFLPRRRNLWVDRFQWASGARLAQPANPMWDSEASVFPVRSQLPFEPVCPLRYTPRRQGGSDRQLPATHVIGPSGHNHVAQRVLCATQKF